MAPICPWSTGSGTSSSSSTSVAPEREDSARLPCLTTGAPRAASTNATAVDTFSVPSPSPPVPHTSIAPGGMPGTATMRARMARTAASSSVTVSPRMCSAVRKAASPPVGTRPSMIWSKATCAIVASSARPASVQSSISRNSGVMAAAAGTLPPGPAAVAASLSRTPPAGARLRSSASSSTGSDRMRP
nr:hypothetical protein [Komagataeibacter europaeus]